VSLGLWPAWLPRNTAAVHLQLIPVSTRRLEAILNGYARQSSVRVVLYLRAERAVGHAVEETAARLGLSDLVRVQRVLIPTAAPFGPVQ
jgi:hypothetical protein